MPLAALGAGAAGARSLSDRIASPGAIGQGTASSGSFQMTPRSACAVPRRSDLVDHLGIRLERAVAVQQSRRDPELLPVLRRQHDAGMLAVGRRAAPDVHRDVPDRAAHHAHQLALRVRPDLQMQARAPRPARPTARGCPARTVPGCRPRRSGPLFQVSEKNPRPSRKRCGVISSTPGMAVGSTIMPAPLRPAPSAPGQDRSCRVAAHASAVCRRR